MCGISGAIGYVDDEVLAAVRRMNDRQKSRGPDSSGEWREGMLGDPKGGVVLAFRRLKVIDLSDDANQPMVDTESGNTIVFNGEIYNYRELRLALQAKGASFRTKSDTEVILKAYARWGYDCVSHMRGMFAFLIWDRKKNRAFGARDRLGIKPLYFSVVSTHDGNKTVLVASQVRAILESGLAAREIDHEGVATYIWNGFVVGPGTLVRSIKMVPAGAIIFIEPDGQVRSEKYWCLPSGSNGGTMENVRRCLMEAIQQHIISDVPLGLFLSGGKDSSAIAALASRLSNVPIETFTITFDEARYNEAAYARRVADIIQSHHHEVPLSEQMFRDHLQDSLASIDQPTFDGINSYFVSRAVKEAGITVALAGTGGDELFGGYRSFRDLPRALQWSRRLGFTPIGMARPLAKLFSRVKSMNFTSMPSQTRWGKLGDVLGNLGNLVHLYQVAYSLFTEDFASRLYDEDLCGAVGHGIPNERMKELESLIHQQNDFVAVSQLEMSMFLGERLLRDTDAASMEVALEVRVPLLDHLVVEAIFELPEEKRFLPIREKAFLHDAALGDFPRDIFDRPKMGFELPLDVWCRRGLRDSMKDLLLDGAACRKAGLNADAVSTLWHGYANESPGLHWSRVWALFVLLWWCNEHQVSV